MERFNKSIFASISEHYKSVGWQSTVSLKICCLGKTFVNNNILLLLCYWQFNIIFNHKTVRSTHIKRGNVHWKKIDFQTFVHTLKSLHNHINILSPFFLLSFDMLIYIYLCEGRIPHIQQISSWVVDFEVTHPFRKKFMLINVKSRAAI